MLFKGVKKLNRTEVSRLGTDRSSMETIIILTCFQANVVISTLGSYDLPLSTRKELIQQIKDVSPKKCVWDNFPLDAKAD
jgi:hypothetical protein